jgi:hypothetical protein
MKFARRGQLLQAWKDTGYSRLTDSFLAILHGILVRIYCVFIGLSAVGWAGQLLGALIHRISLNNCYY